MPGLAEKRCIPCKTGAPTLTKEEIEKYLPNVPGWEVDQFSALTREFEFPNFITSFRFIKEISKLAEKEGHHPDISFGWGYAIVSLITHSIGGLHENDFIMAAKISQIAK